MKQRQKWESYLLNEFTSDEKKYIRQEQQEPQLHFVYEM